jgi:hypothetical protein
MQFNCISYKSLSQIFLIFNIYAIEWYRVKYEYNKTLNTQRPIFKRLYIHTISKPIKSISL